jgi:two-component system OmpR family sensor kinase
MKTSSLRLRVTVATLVVLALTLGGFAVAVTLAYRGGLERDLRDRLTAGTLALSLASGSQIKDVVGRLGLEGIDVELARAPHLVGKRGAPEPAKATAPPSPRAEGGLLVIELRLQAKETAARKISGAPPPTVIARLTASQSSVDAHVHRLIVAEVVAGLVAMTMAAALILLGLRAALKPLAHVGRVAARIAAGDRTQRLRPQRPDTDLGRMAASFDEMVDALDASVAQAERSEAAMRRFLADASHELRTPIAALHATVETLLREQPPRPERDALEARLAREGARLGALVDDLLSLARLEGSDSLRREEVDLVEIAEEVAAETRAHLPHVVIDVSHTDDATVNGDSDALARALRNLLDNAVAATKGVGRLRVEVSRSEADVVLRVSDDGPGVPPSQRERIFDDFVRLEGDGRPGAGLGLAIVRRIAQQHHGSVICEDAERGACFALRIPPAARRSTTTAANGPVHF